ncbi:MAG: acetyl-CoA carboxylase biotin carboxylase subunit, partial [Burkholderiaceae bacterium]|nr:acetyl-CoA carboxylase biotin carboxylase subunit [Burkholderiaceae bacterium]
MFTKILIANRGEIACRVAATARRLGVRTVAIYSDADARARHLAFCDEAVRLGPAPARDSYLRGDLIIAAAKATGAQAIHPGYGFLSENADFAQACAAAGLVFIGPPPAAIRAMGSKSEAKALMQRTGVPLVPGYHGARQDPEFLRQQADAIGYPLLIKASAGGGGKGMRVVTSAQEFDAALAACQREAAAAFGDARVLLEKYLMKPRHIEIQVFADTHGQCVYLFERDCSVQRRHQKIIEEAPAPGISAERRRQMGEAAVAAARAVGYVGAGTVEFIVDPGGDFYFMEMNTRLQVEHPVTEMVTGLDLVEWQLRVACGEPLPLTQAQLRWHGHAIEARLYAENPDRGFLPATGVLKHFALPAAVQFHTGAAGTNEPPAPVRIDSGVAAGDAISPHYDPMIAKLIVWGETRDQALARLRQALADVHIVGVANNVDFLTRLLSHPSFARGLLDTGLIERERETLFAVEEKPPTEVVAAACARILADEAAAAAGSPDPWAQPHGWRLNTTYRRAFAFRTEHAVLKVEVEYLRDGPWPYRLHDGEVTLPLALCAHGSTRLSLQLADRAVSADVFRDGDDLHVFMRGRHRVLTQVDEIGQASEEAVDERLAAPMPGKIVAVHVQRGARVTR